jgi:hypothetical protein
MTVEAWILDTLRFASLAHEVENDDWRFSSPPVSNIADYQSFQNVIVIPDLVSD